MEKEEFPMKIGSLTINDNQREAFWLQDLANPTKTKWHNIIA